MDFASFLEVFAAKMREPPTEEEIFKAYKVRKLEQKQNITSVACRNASKPTLFNAI